MCAKYLTCIAVALFFVSFAMVNSGYAADKMMVYPAKNQSAEQQKKDESDCHQWAVKQSQYDPTQPQKTEPANTANKGRPVAGGAAAGAVVGGIVGSLDGNFGKGAAIGGGIGAAGGVLKRGRQRRQAEKQAEQAQNQKLEQYNKAKAACLEGKGYTVK